MPRPPQPSPADATALVFSQPAIGLAPAAVLMGSTPATLSRLIAAGEFPSPVVRLGSRVLIVSAPLIELLHLTAPDSPDSAAA